MTIVIRPYKGILKIDSTTSKTKYKDLAKSGDRIACSANTLASGK